MTDTRISYCRICEAICGIVVEVDGNRVVKVRGDPDHPVSKGYLCPKAAAMTRVLEDPDRVVHPLRRDRTTGGFVPVSWDDALGDIATRLKGIVREYGPQSVAMYLGNPASFSLSHMFWGKGFLDAIGSTNMYSPMPQDTASRCVASYALYGTPMLFPIPDVPNTDFLVILGANPLVSHGSLISLPRIADDLRAITARGGRVVVVDPARTKTAAAFEHVPVRPGTDGWLVAAMLNVLFASQLVDRDAVDTIANGVEDLARAVEPCTAERAAVVTGVDADVITRLARDFAAAPSAAAYGRVGICRGPHTTVASYLLDALNIVTGNFDRRGGWILGTAPIDLVGMAARFGMATYAKHRTRIGGLPDIAGHMPWVLIDEMTTPGPGQVRALIVTAGNPILSAPDGAGLEKAIQDLDLVVSLDLYVTETNRHADYILPSPVFLERADVPIALLGHMPRPWIQSTEAVVAPPPDVREEWEVFDELARRMGLGAPFGQRSARLLGRIGVRLRPTLIVDLLLRTGRAGDWFGLRRGGLSLRKLRAHPHGLALGDAMPVGSAAAHIQHRDHKIRLADPDVLADLSRMVTEPAVSGPGEVLLVGRRDLRSINSWMHNARGGHGEEPALLVHPSDARTLALVDGGRADVTVEQSSIDVLVHVTEDIAPGVVSYPHGWGHDGGWKAANALGGANVNRLASASLAAKDALSGASHLDGIPVVVRPRAQPA
jgi:formate dehydrogenase